MKWLEILSTTGLWPEQVEIYERMWTGVYLKHADDVFFARYIISVFVVGIVEDNNEQGECWDSYNYYGEGNHLSLTSF